MRLPPPTPTGPLAHRKALMSIRRPSNVPTSTNQNQPRKNNGPSVEFLEKVRNEMLNPTEKAIDSRGNDLFNEAGKNIYRPAVGVRKVTDDEMLTIPSEVFVILWNHRTKDGYTLSSVRHARYAKEFLDWS